MTQLNSGDQSPDFEATNQNGDIVKSDDYAGRKLFVFFYPKANTSG